MFDSWKKSYDQPRQHIKKQRRYFVNKVHLVRPMVSSNHVWMWELDYNESWVPKKRCFWTVVLEKTLESPLDCEEIKPVNPKGDQSWIFIEITDAEAETPILWHLFRRADSFEKMLLLGKIKAGRKGDNRGWDGWMPSPTRWIWVWTSSVSCMRLSPWS